MILTFKLSGFPDKGTFEGRAKDWVASLHEKDITVSPANSSYHGATTYYLAVLAFTRACHTGRV